MPVSLDTNARCSPCRQNWPTATCIAAVDYQHNDGPWDLEEGFRKINGLLKYTRGDRDNGFGITAMGYDGKWKSTDQIPLRAVQDGAIGRFGFVDPTDGGETHRYSLSTDYWTQAGSGKLTALAYAIDYHLDLISNFTYYVDQTDGDQFEQFDDRKIYGGNLRYTMPLTLAASRPSSHRASTSATTTSRRSGCITPVSANDSRRYAKTR